MPEAIDPDALRERLAKITPSASGGTPPDRTALSGRLRSSLTEAPAEKSSSLWDSLKSFASKSVSDLVRGGREIAQGAGELAADAGQALMPGRGGAEASGRVIDKLGDIATFASGGLTGPTHVPQQATGLARGLDVQPRVAQVPRPQLALPPPQMAAAGRPAISTGQGMIPPGPSSTMTSPAASPTIGPREAASARPPPPLIPPGTEAGQPSRFASAFLENNPEPIDKALIKRYRGVVNPRGPDQRTGPGLDMQNQRIMTAVDSIIDAKDTLRFKDFQGNLLPGGRTPRSLDEFVQGIDHLKDQIFEQYDGLAKQQGGKGVQVPLGPAIAKLQELATQPQVADLHPGLVQQAADQAQAWAQRGSYSPKEMQAVVQHLNEELKAQIKNPSRETPTRNAMMAQVLGTLRESLNETMETALQGPQYQSLRNRYASLASIEGDVVNALRREQAKQPGGLATTLTNAAFWVNAVHGVVTLDPTAIARGAALRGGEEIVRRLRSPNRAVTRVFNKRAYDRSASTTDKISIEAATRLGELRQQRYDAIRSGNLDEANSLYPALARARSDARQ